MKKISFLVVFFLAFSQSQAQDNYHQLQAVYIYNFAKYIEWPVELPEFVIGIIGRSEVLGILKTDLKGKKINGKCLIIKHLEGIEDTSQCQIVYIPRSESKLLPAINEIVHNKKILIVTEEKLINKGAAIAFFKENGSLKFVINQSKLKQANLTANAGLLSLAKVVYDKK